MSFYFHLFQPLVLQEGAAEEGAQSSPSFSDDGHDANDECDDPGDEMDEDENGATCYLDCQLSPAPPAKVPEPADPHSPPKRSEVIEMCMALMQHFAKYFPQILKRLV